MIRIGIILCVLFYITPVMAQQQTSPELEAISNKLMQEINSGIACFTNVAVSKREIEKLQAEVKELKTKIEEKK